MRTFAPVVVRGKESEGVKFWGFGKTVYQELLGVIADPDYGDITDATNGRDIGIERQTPAEAGNQYGKTTVRVKPNQTPITEDAEMLKILRGLKPTVTLDGKETKDFNGETYVMETALKADISIIKAWKADTNGNLVYRKTARNFNPVMATAGKGSAVIPSSVPSS